MRMEAMTKIILKFDKCWWLDDLHGMICADCFIPEIWVNSTKGTGMLVDPKYWEPVAEEASEDGEEVEYFVVGFCAGSKAEKVH